MTSTPLRPVLVLSLALVVGACGAARSTIRATSTSGATKAVTYRGATLQVPVEWPVHDLLADPSRCARFDVHAVYLGHQGSGARCPARLVGKTEAVQVEPLDDLARGHVLPSTASRQINGQAASLEPGSDASHNIVATFPELGVVVTATFNADEALAMRIVESVKREAP